MHGFQLTDFIFQFLNFPIVCSNCFLVTNHLSIICHNNLSFHIRFIPLRIVKHFTEAECIVADAVHVFMKFCNIICDICNRISSCLKCFFMLGFISFNESTCCIILPAFCQCAIHRIQFRQYLCNRCSFIGIGLRCLLKYIIINFICCHSFTPFLLFDSMVIGN